MLSHWDVLNLLEVAEPEPSTSTAMTARGGNAYDYTDPSGRDHGFVADNGLDSQGNQDESDQEGDLTREGRVQSEQLYDPGVAASSDEDYAPGVTLVDDGDGGLSVAPNSMDLGNS